MKLATLKVPIMVFSLAIGIAAHASAQTNTNKVNITNFGGAQIDIDATNGGGVDYRIWARASDAGGSDYFSIDSSTAGTVDLLRLNRNTPSSFMTITGANYNGGTNSAGIGLGTTTPMAPLHIRAGSFGALTNASILVEDLQDGATATPEKMLEMKNFGPVFLSMSDTSQPTPSTWQMYTSPTDWFWIRKFSGNINPSIQLRQNGDFSVATNPSAPGGGGVNFTVKGATGNIFYRGIDLSNSDRNKKENFRPVDPAEVLQKVVDLPISTWNYIHDQSDRRLIGPMAQDFHAAFQLGDCDKTIAGCDKDGVALAAIQGLNMKIQAKDEKIGKLNEQVGAQADLIAQLSERLERLEQATLNNQR